MTDRRDLPGVIERADAETLSQSADPEEIPAAIKDVEEGRAGAPP